MSSATPSPATQSPAPARKKYIRAVGPRLRILLGFIFALVALLSANALYLAVITTLESITGKTYQNYFYQYMFLLHLVFGLLLVGPFVVFGIAHIYNAWNRQNHRAVKMGYVLFAISLAVLVSGIALMRLQGFEIKNPNVRRGLYWAHVITPLLAVWAYVIHRLAGPRIKWRIGLRWGLVTAALVAVMAYFNFTDPRKWDVAGPKEGQQYFMPSLARTATGNFIPARTLMMDQYCEKCHADIFNGWFHSAHHFSSFNNEAYLFSVRETRRVALTRDGDVKAARWCAGCHDPAPFFSGAFDDPKFDDVNHPTAKAGITCTTCHAITHINSTRGNADYTIEEPIHYPFAFSTSPVLQWINQQLVKAKPEFHKKTFLKPLHRSAEFCSTCHKVSIPGELNHYKEFLRGQNHYDTFLLSGASGHGARSFYYPDKAQANCAGCHMPTQPSNDFAANFYDPARPGTLVVHNHLFPAANTALPAIRKDDATLLAEQEFLKGSARVDIFGVKEGGTIDQPLIAPLRPSAPVLKPGGTYLIEVVVRNIKTGHPLTQGTVDSNELWLDVTAADPQRVIGRSGALGEQKAVDPWAHFLNVYMLDRNGNRIDRRNPQDIFTPLYDHQVPPGAATVTHYKLTVPPDQREPLTVDVKLQYRKFDTRYMQYVFGEDHVNDLPITTIAADRVVFPIDGGSNAASANPPSSIVEWQRWNDYGIALLQEGEKGSEKGELIQAAQAFSRVENLQRPDGPLNIARVFIKEGRLDDARVALERAAQFAPPAPRWTLAWLSGTVNKQNGMLDQAISDFRSILENTSPDLQQRGFDFSKDYLVINELGQTLFERAKLERGEDRAAREQFLKQAAEQFNKTLALDSENVTAHYNLALIFTELGYQPLAEEHRKLHESYRVDDNARDRAVELARRANASADHAAQAIVIYSLQRDGAPGLQPLRTTWKTQ